MKKIYLFFFVSFLIFCRNETAEAQTLEPNYGAPSAPVSVCDGNATAKVKIIGSSAACAQGTLTITPPSGYFYVPGSATVTGGSGSISTQSVNANVATVKLANIPAVPDSTVISYQVYATCNAIGSNTSQAGYSLNSCIGTYSATSNAFNTQSASLNFSSVTNNNYGGLLGDVFPRAINIVNSGVGNISQFTLTDSSGKSFYISGATVSAGWNITSTKAVYGTDTIITYSLSGPDLSQGQSVTITENVKIVSQCYLASTLTASFGCNGNVCGSNSVTAGATISNADAPVLKVIPQMTNLNCRNQVYPQQIEFANIGNAALFNLSVNIFSVVSGLTPNVINFNPADVQVDQTAYSNFQYKIGANGAWTAITPDSVKTFTSPAACLSGMPSNVFFHFPKLRPGDSLFLSYNEQNCPVIASSSSGYYVGGAILRYVYSDACGNSINPASSWARMYKGIRASLSTQVPGVMRPSQPYSVNYTFQTFGGTIYSNGSSVRFEVILPAGVVFSGNASDMALTNALTGVTVAAPNSFTYNAATNTIEAIYQTSSTLPLSSLNGSNFGLQNLSLNCSAASGSGAVSFNAFITNTGPCSLEDQFVQQLNSISFACPAACSNNGGIAFNNFTVSRTNFGLPDNNNDGIPDAGGTLDFTKVKTDFAMQGDTVRAAFTGIVHIGSSSPSSGFNYGYAIDTITTSQAKFKSLYAGIQIFASGSSTPFYTCNNLPIAGGNGQIRTVDFSISTLNSISALPTGYTKYNDGDSIVVNLYYQIQNPGSAYVSTTLSNSLFVSNIANPPTLQQYYCGTKLIGYCTLIGFTQLPEVIKNITQNGPGNITVTLAAGSDWGPNLGSRGLKPFVYEYRPVSIFDTAYCTIPNGFDFVSATVAYAYTTGINVFSSKSVAIAPTSVNGNNLVFNFISLFSNGTFPYGDQGTDISLNLIIKPNCSAAALSSFTGSILQIPNPSYPNAFPVALPNPTGDSIFYSTANILATAGNNNYISNTDTASWDIQISSNSTIPPTNVWMAQETGVGGVTILNIQQLSGLGGTVQSVLSPTSAGIYQLGNFNFSSGYYRINALYTGCSKDSMHLAYWYDCSGSGYPATLATAPYKADLNLYAVAQQPSLQLGIVSQPNDPLGYNFCDTLPFELENQNTGSTPVSNLAVKAFLPHTGGLNYTPNSLQLQFPAGSGTYVSIPDSQIVIGVDTITFNVPATTLAQIEPGQSYRLKFGMQASCGFSSGGSVRFAPSVSTPCGQVNSGVIQQTQNIQIKGAPSSTNLYIASSNIADTVAQICSATQRMTVSYQFKIVNQGPLPTTNSDGYSIALPGVWQLDSTTIVYSHNPNNGTFLGFSNGTYNFNVGANLAVGDSVVMNAQLFVPASLAASVPLGASGFITENAVVRFTGYCSSGGVLTPCPASQILVTTNQTSIIQVKNTLYSFDGFSIQDAPSPDNIISGTFTINHQNTVSAHQLVKISLYKDVNANQVYDAGDLYLGLDSVYIDSAQTETHHFNIASNISGSFCPSLIAVADFGCYQKYYAFTCATANILNSNAGSQKLFSNCSNSLFQLAAADLSGKWVVDSGTAVLSSAFSPSAIATVSAGSTVRLLWYRYAPGGDSSVIVFPDSIRLTNSANQLIITNPSSVCAPAVIDITLPALTLGSTPGFAYSYFADSLGTIMLNNPQTIGTSGVYYIRAISTNAGCSSIKPVNIVINPKPILVLNTAGTTICSPGGGTIDLTAASITAGSSTGVNFNYFADSTGLQLLPNPSMIGNSGTYYINAIDPATGCVSDIKPITLSIGQIPSLQVSSSSTDICKGDSVLLIAISAGNQITWINVGSGDSVQVNPTQSTFYQAVASSSMGCSDTTGIQINVKPFVLSLVANPQPLLAGVPENFVTSGNINYSVIAWSPANLFSDQTAQTQTIVLNGDSTSISVIGQSDGGCRDTASLTVIINANLKDFFIPNNFSPNGDGNNDVFKIYGSSIKTASLSVFNQWGQLIFTSNDPNQGWNGMWKGNEQPVGPYVYVAKVTFQNNENIVRKGTVTLIR